MPRRSPVPAGRYTLKKAVFEIEEQLRLRGRGSAKEASVALGITEQAFSAKMRGVYSNWSIEEIGRLADVWDAPTGWPWIPWGEAKMRDEITESLSRPPHS